jgi:ribulokinase
MNDYLLGVDIGCGGVKACIIDIDGNVLGYSFREHEIISKQPGWSESDPNIFWRNICGIIKEILEKSQTDPKKIKGISVSSAVPSLVMVNKLKNPINLSYNFFDSRALDQIQWLKDNIGEEKIFKISAFGIDEQPILTSLMWEKDNRKNDYNRIYKALTPDGFVNLKLTGKATLNYSCAVFYGVAFDIRNKKFDSGILKEIGINEEILPELYPCEEKIGEVTSEAAKETGLSPGIPVIAGAVDAFAGWIGGGAINEGDMQINLGTAAVIGAIKRSTEFLPNMWNMIYPINSKNNYALFGTTTTGGHLIRYIRDNFSQYEKSIENILKIDSYDLLSLEAQKVGIGSDRLIVLPFFKGARTPEYNRDARGVVFGMSLSHTKGHLIRAIMEGVAYSTYSNFLIIEKNISKINYPVVMNEGGAKNRLWRKIFTDVFNKPTVFVENRTGAPYGNAILAGVSLGALHGYEVAKEWARYIDYMEPDQKNHDLYMEYFQLYKKIYKHLEADFLELSRI